ncbi:pyridoxal phosphate-dependent transferase [Mortierella sp. GBAus27b]|nr:pyridoxal phosphate-dependent transferase [Mortierella sp. GBAus27b]
MLNAASGGFVAPFAFPQLRWSFELPRVNTSGHKYGLAYPGIGWVLWRSEDYLPKELVFTLSYLGAEEQTYTLNFSRPACFMIAQYYNFVRLGREGYTSIIKNDLRNAGVLSAALEKTGYFDLVSDMHRAKGVFSYAQKDNQAVHKSTGDITDYNPALPVVTFKLKDEFKPANPHIKQSALSTLLRTRGWIIPNYSLPPNEEHVEILRVVVRESLSQDLVDSVVADTIWATETLAASESRLDVEIFTRKSDPIADAHRLETPSDNKRTCGRQC